MYLSTEEPETGCVCFRFSFLNFINPYSRSEQGVNSLFDDRAQEFIQHEEAVQLELAKKQTPDRVYGLRMTNRLEQLLLSTRDKRESSEQIHWRDC